MDSILALITYIWPFIVVIMTLVFVHEMGHYIAARVNGVRVEDFSIGFGPELFGWTDHHQTRWKVCLIPLGGYVKMLGDEDASSKPDQQKLATLSPEELPYSIHTKTPLQRLIIAAAGPFANFLLTLVTLAFLFATHGKKEADPVIGFIVEGGSAARAGLHVGDRITAVQVEGGEKPTLITEFPALQKIINANPEKNVRLFVTREGAPLEIESIPEKSGTVGVLGIRPTLSIYPGFQAVIESFKMTWELSAKTLSSFWQMITGKQDGRQLGGMFTIARYAHDFAAQGFPFLLEFLALLSLNLGLINLFPIPVLDGGHIVFCLIEIILGRPVPPKVQEIAYRVGLGLVIALMIFSHWNDLVRLKFFGLF